MAQNSVGLEGSSCGESLWLVPVPGVLCGSLSAIQQDSWLPQNWCETSHYGARVAGWRGHQEKKRKEKKKEGGWGVGTISNHNPLIFPIFHGLPRLQKSKVQRLAVASELSLSVLEGGS